MLRNLHFFTYVSVFNMPNEQFLFTFLGHNELCQYLMVYNIFRLFSPSMPQNRKWRSSIWSQFDSEFETWQSLSFFLVISPTLKWLSSSNLKTPWDAQFCFLQRLQIKFLSVMLHFRSICRLISALQAVRKSKLSRAIYLKHTFLRLCTN